jgi:hypothetical protein
MRAAGAAEPTDFPCFAVAESPIRIDAPFYTDAELDRLYEGDPVAALRISREQHALKKQLESLRSAGGPAPTAGASRRFSPQRGASCKKTVATSSSSHWRERWCECGSRAIAPAARARCLI